MIAFGMRTTQGSCGLMMKGCFQHEIYDRICRSNQETNYENETKIEIKAETQMLKMFKT